LPAARARHFAAFHSEALNLEWPHRFYRLLFLGPLPHILLCLQFSGAHALALKDKAKQHLQHSMHRELEEVGKRLTLYGGIWKDIKRLQKALDPKADTHRRRDLEGLKALVEEVKTIVNRLPPGQYDLRDDLNLGIKGIMKTRVTKKPAKPDLVFEDDL